MKRLNLSVLAVVAMAAALTSPVFSGTEYEFEVTDHKRNKVELTKLQVEGSNLRMGRAARSRKDAGGSLLFQGDRREGKEPRVILEDGQGGHVVVNQAAVDEMVKMVPEPAMRQETIDRAWAHAEAIADPEERARALAEVEKTLGPRAGDPAKGVEYVERGVREKFGYPSVRYDAMRDGVKVAEIWATDWANLEGGRQTSKAFAELQEFYAGLMKSLAEAAGSGADLFEGHESALENIFELNRFPVAVYEHDGSEVVRSSVLKSATKVEHDPSVFKPAERSVERQFRKK